MEYMDNKYFRISTNKVIDIRSKDLYNLEISDSILLGKKLRLQAVSKKSRPQVTLVEETSIENMNLINKNGRLIYGT